MQSRMAGMEGITTRGTGRLDRSGRRMRRLVWTVGCVLAGLAPRALADVLIVGPGHYGEIQGAVDAAVDGDLILVRSSTSGPVTIDGKGLTLVADAGVSPVLSGALTVQNLLGDQDVVIAGISATSSSGKALILRQNQGSIRTLGGAFHGSDGVGQHKGGSYAAYMVVNSDVACTHTLFVGGVGDSGATFHAGYAGASAVFATGTKVALYHCRATGGPGGNGGWEEDGGPGGDALETPDSVLFASGCVLTGGSGGAAGDVGIGITVGGGGGSGVRLYAFPAEAQLLDNLYYPGPGGAGGSLPGHPGRPVVSGPGAIENQIPDVSRGFEVSWPLHEQTQATVTFEGEPQDAAFLLVSAETGFAFSAPFQGTLLASQPLIRRLFLGTIGSSGMLQNSIPMPPLPAGVEHQTLYVQGLVRDPAGQVTLADGTALILLDPAY